MKPIDIRNHNWITIRAQLAGRLQEVYDAWITHGPGTTRELAEQSGIDILNLRPRTTDLLGLGLVEMVGSQDGHGIYKARTQTQWEHWINPQRISADGQLTLI